MEINNINISWPKTLISELNELQGNKRDISMSNTKNKIPITKNLIEKGWPG